jgi:hypothetical protein
MAVQQDDVKGARSGRKSGSCSEEDGQQAGTASMWVQKATGTLILVLLREDVEQPVES